MAMTDRNGTQTPSVLNNNEKGERSASAFTVTGYCGWKDLTEEVCDITSGI